MIPRITEQELIRRACDLARKVRREIDHAGIAWDFDRIAGVYGVTLVRTKLRQGNPGCYIKEQRKIILDPSVQSQERLNFTFFHELMHDQIERDEDLLTLLADAYVDSVESTMERLCNAGAAELLIPAFDLEEIAREQGFSTSLIPKLCDRYNASSIAVAFKMISIAAHDCYLTIAEPQYISPVETKLPMLLIAPMTDRRWGLVITYSATSPSIRKYSIKTGQVVSREHLMYTALQHEEEEIRGQAKIPFASGKGWEVDFDTLYYRGNVFSFFHASPRIGTNQLRLF